MRDAPRTNEARERIRREDDVTTTPETTAAAAVPRAVERERGWGYGDARDIEQNVNVVTPRDRVRWGPIVAGLLSALTVFIALSVLGAAVGATTLYANGTGSANTNHYGVAAGIWGAASALIAFFIGGFVAAKTAAVGGGGNGWINGVMVFVASLPLIIWLTSQGAGSLFGALGNNIYDLRNLVTNTYSDQAARDAAMSSARNGLWWTLVAILVGLIASGLGGLVGHRGEREIWRGDTGADTIA